jgi:hypothetical protein
MGQWAVNYLLDPNNHNHESAPPQILLECPPILRKSHQKEIDPERG